MAESGSNVPPLSLRPWPVEKSEDNATLKFQDRLFRERGHFRNITEEDLEEEVRKVELGVEEEKDDDEEEAAPDYRKRTEELFRAKNEMLTHIAQAHNQAMIMRDFVSLLVSKDNPRVAALSMSPAVAKEVPSGSIAIQKWDMPPRSEEQKENERLIAQGARIEAASNAADRLLKAATRLETEVRKETKYWEQILSVKEKGWSIRRIPNVEPSTYGVQVGSAEAGGQFKRRGFIPLRTDSDGSVLLDREQAITPKAVRVRVVRGDQTIGTSRLPLLSSLRELNIEESIRHARDTLFEEELFHEMTLEARILLSYDVQLRNNEIIIPTGAKSGALGDEIRIDLVDLDDSTFPSSQIMDTLAQAVAFSLRLLLCYVFRQRFKRRTEIPPPLSNRKQEKAPEVILRPIMTFFRHQTDVTAVRQFSATISNALKAAGHAATVVVKTDIDLADLAKGTTTESAESTFEKLLAALIAPLKTTISITTTPSNPSISQIDISIDIRTLMYAPLYGTEYSLQMSPSTNKKLTFATSSDLITFISRSISKVRLNKSST